ncbi:hypothetical protein DPMN_181217 [Dreissena polymorpha]|uniref:Uncharacterized protein n=1 Tax=Dreissena polymorpha TaxID=45954 RepID=A0A9D4I1E1_DREPO|nr:hypothetical protein DPMN_181217 [Dreissena polymorpha]
MADKSTSVAADYVISIMSSQIITKVATPSTGSRKRHRSVSGTCDTASKKTKGDSPVIAIEDRSNSKARRNLYKESRKSSRKFSPETAPMEIVVDKADVHVNPTLTLQQMFDKLSSDVHMMYMGLNERFDQFEKTLESRITNKVSQILDKRVNSELEQIKRGVDQKLETKYEQFSDTVKADIADDLAAIWAQIDSLSTMRHPVTTSNNSQQITQDRTLNVVIRNLPETASESTSSKVNAMLKDGLKLSNITVSKAERKKSRTESRPGVVIATFKCKEDKQTVMNAKPDLRHISQYSKVFFNHDLAPEQRKNSQNFATILSAIKSDNITMRGTRIVNRRSDDNREELRPDNRDSGRDSYRYRPNTNDRREHDRRDNGDRRDTRYNSRHGDYHGIYHVDRDGSMGRSYRGWSDGHIRDRR